MGSPKKIKVEKPLEVNQDLEEPKEEPKIEITSGNSCFVELKDGSKRYYSRMKDGNVWKTLAKNYAEANKGKIV